MTRLGPQVLQSRWGSGSQLAETAAERVTGVYTPARRRLIRALVQKLRCARTGHDAFGAVMLETRLRAALR